jgi:hypothetical protein
MKHTDEDLKNDVALLPLRVLSAGNATVTYEEGRLRYIAYNDCEAVRMIFPALRDDHWVTIPMEISNETITEKEKTFSISFHGSFHSSAVKFEADFSIAGNEDGTIVFEMNGKALNSFKSKRTGLCVHHPIQACAGREVEIVHPGENVERLSFPVLISPHRPFTDVTGMRYVTSNNIAVEINFEGEEFETEDQRNWSDDSYKTYSGPQYKTPMLDIHEGDILHHCITVKLEPAGAIKHHQKKQDFRSAFPQIGYGFPLEEKSFDGPIENIPCDHLSVDIDLQNKSWKRDLSNTGKVPLRLTVRFADFSADEANDLAAFIDGSGITVKSIMVVAKEGTPPPHEGYHTVYHQLKKTSPQIAVGFGSASWFAGVNENINDEVLCDFTGFVVMPQVHQTDERSIMENLLSQHTILETLQKQTGDRPANIHFLFSRADDARLHTQLGAWWVLNAIADLGASGIITLSNLIGKNGILNEGNAGSPLVRLLQRIRQFGPVRISCERNMSERDPMSSVRSSRVTLENAQGETIGFTMKDI